MSRDLYRAARIFESADGPTDRLAAFEAIEGIEGIGAEVGTERNTDLGADTTPDSASPARLHPAGSACRWGTTDSHPVRFKEERCGSPS